MNPPEGISERTQLLEKTPIGPLKGTCEGISDETPEASLNAPGRIYERPTEEIPSGTPGEIPERSTTGIPEGTLRLILVRFSNT